MQHALAILHLCAHRQLSTPITSERMVIMDNSSGYPDASALPSKVTLHSFFDSMRVWRDGFLDLVVLEGKRAGIGLALMFGFGAGATLLSITGWLALLGCLAAVLVENDILGWAGSLLLVALLNFAGAGGLVFLAIKRKRDLLFAATRQQLGMTSAPTPGHVNDTPAELELAQARVAASASSIAAQGQALKSKLRRQVTSPPVIGGLVTAAAAAAYFGLRRSTKPPDPSPQPKAHGNLVSVLKTAQMLLPFLGAVGAANAALKRNQGAAAPVLPQSPSAVQKPVAEAPTAAPLHGNWLSQQWQMIKAAVKAWVDDYAPSMGAALSYNTLFSLAPLLLIVIAVAGMVFGQEAAQGEIVAQLRGIMGAEGAVTVEGMLKAAREPATSLVASVVGIALLLLGATAIFAELQSALDRIWRVPAPQAESGIWYLLRTRLLSFGLVLGLGFMLTVSLVVSAALAALGKWWGAWFEGWDVLLEILNFAVSLGIFTLLFAMIYKLMPRANIPWRDVWTGAAVTALLFTIGKGLIGLYLGKSSLASEFGAAGSFVVLIAWVYYSAQIFLFGAEYTWVYANRRGSRVPMPTPGNKPAVPDRQQHLNRLVTE